MQTTKDFKWEKGLTVADLVNKYGNLGFQSIELEKASKTIVKMKKAGAKIYLTFTSNMCTSGLNGFFAQLIKLGMVDAVVTTAGSIEEDIMKSLGEKFIIGDFHSDDVALYEKGVNRVGNLFITNESYAKFEDYMNPVLTELYKQKPRWTVSELLQEIGLLIDYEDSILSQAAKKNIPIFCPGITD